MAALAQHARISARKRGLIGRLDGVRSSAFSHTFGCHEASSADAQSRFHATQKTALSTLHYTYVWCATFLQARQERKAAYEVTSKDVTKWQAMVKANREAPTLAFSKPRGAAGPATTTAALTAQFQPETDMEAQVAAMLRAAGVDSGKAVQDGEDALALKVRPLVFPKTEDTRDACQIVVFERVDWHHFRAVLQIQINSTCDCPDDSFLLLSRCTTKPFAVFRALLQIGDVTNARKGHTEPMTVPSQARAPEEQCDQTAEDLH